jgi:hypothetical protein
MTRLDIRIEAGELKSLLSRAMLAIDKVPKKVIKEELEGARDEARAYPPELPGQRYRRTGTYYKSFQIKPVTSGYVLESDARQNGRAYTQYVGGDNMGQMQALVHRGRWALIANALAKARDRIIERANEEFRRILEHGGAP